MQPQGSLRRFQPSRDGAPRRHAQLAPPRHTRHPHVTRLLSRSAAGQKRREERDVTGKTVQLPWGKATFEEEATVPGEASEREMELGVARLTGADGEQLLRFFYRADGRMVRGPLTLRPSEVAALAQQLRKQPALRKLVAGLGK